MIELKNITKIYNTRKVQTVALENISLRIDAGEFVAICGESGTGKSTLLNLIGCIDIPTTGEYFLNGEKLIYNRNNSLDNIRKNKFSFIFQNFALMDRYTIYENIEMPLIAKNINRKERKKRIKNSVLSVGLNEPLYKFPHELSGGQQQRVAIARALAMENPVILADEPTGALDESNSLALINTFLELKEKGITIIMVTHNLSMANYADRIIQMESL